VKVRDVEHVTPKAKKKAPHPCWAKVNAALAPRNGELDMAMTVNLGNSTTGAALYIPVRRIKPRGPKPPSKLFLIHCPFCGEKLDE
jgi:hypothetical protein